MIYVCIPSYNEAPTVGLLLWKVRQVFAGFPREYQLLVLDDGSDDATAEVLERYTRVLPLTVIRHQARRGYAASVEELLRQAVERTDRPKRDSAILMHADFAHGPNFIPDLVRRIESGADIVIAQSKLEGRTVSRPALDPPACPPSAPGSGLRARCDRRGLRVLDLPARHPAKCLPRCSRPAPHHRGLGRQRRAVRPCRRAMPGGWRPSPPWSGAISGSGRAGSTPGPR